MKKLVLFIAAAVLLSAVPVFAEGLWQKEILDSPGFSESYKLKLCTVNLYRDGSGIQIIVRNPEILEPLFVDMLKVTEGTKTVIYGNVGMRSLYIPQATDCLADFEQLPEKVRLTYR